MMHSSTGKPKWPAETTVNKELQSQYCHCDQFSHLFKKKKRLDSMIKDQTRSEDFILRVIYKPEYTSD